MDLIETKIGNHNIAITDKGCVWWTYHNGWAQTNLHRGYDGRWYTNGGVPVADSYQHKIDRLMYNTIYNICKRGE